MPNGCARHWSTKMQISWHKTDRRRGALHAFLRAQRGGVFLVFTLLYTPCVAAVAAIRRELDFPVWKTFGVVVFQCLLAWGLGAAVYHIALLI